MLELLDPLLDRVARDQAVGEHRALLTVAMGSVDRLCLTGRVPPWVEQKHVVGGGQVEAGASGFEADQKDSAIRVVLKVVDSLLAVSGRAIEGGVANPQTG